MAIQIDGDSGVSGVNGSATTPALQGTDSNTGIVFGTDTVQVATGGSTRATVDSSGNVGIGTASIASGGANTTNFNVHTPSATSVYLKLSNSSTGNSASDAFDLSADSSGNAYLINRENGYMTFWTNSTEKVRVTSSGDVGINNSAPADKLHVGGNIRYGTNTTYYGVIEHDAATTGANIYTSKDTGGHMFKVGTTPVEAMRIGVYGRSHSFSTDGATQILANGYGSGTSNYLIIGRHSATAVDNGTNAFFVFTNGNVQNLNNSYGQISDVKLKENIVNANSQWDDIKDVRVRNFNFKEETGNPTHTQIGVVAQELETVSPGLVYETPDCDAEGNDLGTVTKAVNYSVLYMKLSKLFKRRKLESKHLKHSTPTYWRV